jgi:uncharacterized protein YjbJ (UPF0337 family)
MDDMRYQAGQRMDNMHDQADQMRDQRQRMMNRAGYQMEEWQSRARYEGRRRGQQMVRNLEDNPLTYGALALAAGAALALLLPQTHTENRAFGEMRDEVMDRGQEVFETAKDHAQQVVEEVRPELEQKARQIVSDVKETGKQAVQDAANELRPVVDKAVSAGKEEARSAAQDVGIDPDKLTTSKSGSGSSSSGSSSMSSGSSMGSGSTSGTAKSGDTSTSNMSQGKGMVINRDTLRGQWNQIKGNVKSKWGQLTDDDLTRVEGDYDKLLGVIQTRYGYGRERAERELNDFLSSQSHSSQKA